MATSKLTLYYNTLLTPEHNAMWSQNTTNDGGFANWLATGTATKATLVIEPFQWIRHKLDITIKIDNSQQLIDKMTYNYAAIKNSDDDRTYYYFVLNMNQVAQHTVELVLSLDSIATFWNEIQSNLNDKTMIRREHRDRFYKISGNINDGDLLIRKIDPISEGIQLSNKVMIQDKTINDTNIPISVKKWYLVYRTEVNDKNLNDVPIKCYLCADQNIKFNTNNNYVVSFKTSELNKDYTYYLVDTLSNKSATELASVTYNPQENKSPITYTLGSKMTAPDTTMKVIRIFYEDDKWKIEPMRYTGGGTTEYEYYAAGSGTFEINDIKNELLFNNLKLGFIHKSQIITTDYYTILSYCDEDPVFGQQITVEGIDSVDRTMSNLNTIIELPYCATNDIIYVSSSQLYNYNSNIWEWSPVNLQFRLKNLNSEFYRNLVQQYQIPDLAYIVNTDELSPNSERNDVIESKIYHSDFSTLKYVYDSFSMELARERLTISGDLTIAPELELGFKQSNNITSNLLFKLNFDGQDVNYKKIADNEDVLLATRNNELTIFQSDYINYMRNGYNYDKKAQAIANKQQVINVVGNTLGTILSVGVNGLNIGYNVADSLNAIQAAKEASQKAAGLIPSNRWAFWKGGTAAEYREQVGREVFKATGIGTQLAVNSATNLISSIGSAITTRQQQENSMSAKLAQLEAQSASTVGSNDLNLLNFYNGNKLHEMKYSITEEMKKPIYDMFYYLGYTTNYQAKPDLYSRNIFNYIIATPEFTNIGVFDTYLNDIKVRFASGLTIWHNNAITSYGQNNIETWIANQLIYE